MGEVAAASRAQPQAGQRAYVNLLFADVCDYTSLSESIDLEYVDELRQQLEAKAAEVIQRHGGAISQVYGDGLLAVFGYPSPREDDARRAVEAALELHALTRSTEWRLDIPLAFELRIHSGVHSGLVLVRQGDALHGRYDLAGDTVNTASRLCAAAGRDEVIVSSTVLRGIEPLFELQPEFDLTLKGKRMPLSVRRVVGRSNVRSRFEASTRRGLTDLVDRVHELAELKAALRKSLAERGRIAAISGAPGIGKTRLLQEFARHAGAEGVAVLRGTCDSYGETAPLEPFIQVLRQVFDLQPNQPPEQIVPVIQGRLLRLFGRSDDTGRFLRLLAGAELSAVIDRQEAQSVATVQVISGLLEALVRERPLALILDDWQWADDASRAVLSRIAASIQRTRGCVVLGLRAGERLDPSLNPDYAFTLTPFDESESRAALAHLRPDALDLGLSAALHRRSGGNPLFLEELCLALANSRSDELSGEVPSTIQGVIQVRVAALPEAPARVLRAASVIGLEFSQPLLAELLGDDQLEAALDMLCDVDLVHPSPIAGVYRFKHGITRDVVYDSVLISERRRMHRTAALAVANGVVATDPASLAEMLAYHYRGSGDHEQSARYSELAGDRAMQKSSLDRARFHYSAALLSLDELLPSPEIKRRWLSVSTRWALPFVYSPSRDRLGTLDRAAACAIELADHAGEAQIQHWRGWTHYTLGDYAESVQRFQQAVAMAERANSPRLIAQSWACLGQTHAAAGEYPRALECLERGLALKLGILKGRRGSALAQGYAYALGCQALAHADRGDFDQAAREFDESLALVSGSGHAIEGSILGLLCMAQIWRGLWQEAIATAARNRMAAERVNSPYSFAMSSAFEAFAGWTVDRRPNALARMRRAVEWLETRDIGLFCSFNFANLADALLESGDAEQARVYADRALARARRRDPLGEAHAHRVLARLHARARGPGHEQQVELHLAEAYRAASARGSRHDLAKTRLLAAQLYAQSGAGPAAQAAAREALAEFGAMRMDSYADQAATLPQES